MEEKENQGNPYNPVMPFARLEEELQRYRDFMPESAIEHYDELIEAFQYAAREAEQGRIVDSRSEYSHYESIAVSIQLAGNDLDNALGALNYDIEKHGVVDEVAEVWTEAFDVLLHHEDLAEKPNLLRYKSQPPPTPT